MTSGSKSVLFGISSISSRAALVLPAPNAPLIQTITVPPLLLAPCGLPVTACHGNQPLMGWLVPAGRALSYGSTGRIGPGSIAVRTSSVYVRRSAISDSWASR